MMDMYNDRNSFSDDSDEELLLAILANESQPKQRFEISTRRFRLDSYNEVEFLSDFRFTKDDFKALCTGLGLNAVMLKHRRTRFSGEEGLAMLLYRLSYPRRLKDFCQNFGRCQAAASSVLAYMLDWICKTFETQIYWDRERLSLEKLQDMAVAVSKNTPQLEGCFGLTALFGPFVGRKVQNRFFSGHK